MVLTGDDVGTSEKTGTTCDCSEGEVLGLSEVGDRVVGAGVGDDVTKVGLFVMINSVGWEEGDEVGDEVVGDGVVGDPVGDSVVGGKVVGDGVVGDAVGGNVVGDNVVGDAVRGREEGGDVGMGV
jgi:hypothetical protein